MKTVCIMCPVSCELTITKKGKDITVTGNACNRGIDYGIAESTDPKRVVTTLVKTDLGVLSCKTNGMVPKDKVFEVLKKIAKLKLNDARVGDVIISDVCDTKIDVVITGNYQTKM